MKATFQRNTSNWTEAKWQSFPLTQRYLVFLIIEENVMMQVLISEWSGKREGEGRGGGNLIGKIGWDVQNCDL